MAATQSIDAIWVKRACQRIKTAGLPVEQLLSEVGWRTWLHRSLMSAPRGAADWWVYEYTP
jgi:hypothetical protein